MTEAPLEGVTEGDLAPRPTGVWGFRNENMKNRQSITFSTPEFKISTGPLEDGLCRKWKEFIDLGFECRLYFKRTV